MYKKVNQSKKKKSEKKNTYWCSNPCKKMYFKKLEKLGFLCNYYYKGSPSYLEILERLTAKDALVKPRVVLDLCSFLTLESLLWRQYKDLLQEEALQ